MKRTLPCLLLLALLDACTGTVETGAPDGSSRTDAQPAAATDAAPAVLDAADPTVDASALPADAARPADAATPTDAASTPADAATTPADAAMPPDAAISVCSGAACVRPSSCPAGSPAARFVVQTPPSSLEPLASADVSVTFANCGTRAWKAAPDAGAASGMKLGSWSPQDNTRWGGNRFVLPADVPVGSEITIPFTVRAPSTAGSWAFSWALVDEGAAWLAQPSPTVNVAVADQGGPVTLCAGVTADPTGAARADPALQACLDATPTGGVLAIPAGTYRMEGAVRIDHPLTLRTAGASGDCLASTRCAALQAAPDLDVAEGFLQLTASDVTLDHLVLDGHRAARLGSSAAARCASGTDNRHGFNATNAGGARCSFLSSASVNALCGTGFEWHGDDATITGSTFKDNGENAAKNMWSDGLTLLQSDRARVEGNWFIDNSDVDLICGGSRGGSIQGNTISQTRQVAFAGLMLDNFNGGTHGDFAGAAISGNTVSCGASLCHFGIELGPHPWYLSANTEGGTVTGNTVSGARQGIDVEGAGTAASPIRVYLNPVSGNSTRATFLCGDRDCSALNISPDSVVDRNGDGTPATSWIWHDCP